MWKTKTELFLVLTAAGFIVQAFVYITTHSSLDKAEAGQTLDQFQVRSETPGYDVHSSDRPCVPARDAPDTYACYLIVKPTP